MSLNALSPLDGRYADKVEPLSDFFSEQALMHCRVLVEIEYLLALLDVIPADTVPALSHEQRAAVQCIADEFKESDAKAIKAQEKITNHDVKAVEYFLRERIGTLGLARLFPWIHFGLTSEDVNNLAYGLMLRDALTSVINPIVDQILEALEKISEEHAATVMLARTHGQSASPTTFGKEMAVFWYRLQWHAVEFQMTEECLPTGKLAGATGNYSAHIVAFPEIDWVTFAAEFVASLGLAHNPLVTQIESHDRLAEIFHGLVRFNTVLIGLNQDIWRYISDGWIGQKVKKGEVGSSTMPHKVNPIDFENSEGNLQLANTELGFFADKLLISRLQRDLTDSTVMRNIGVALGHGLLGYQSCLKGLSKINIKVDRMREEVDAHPEVLAEAVQTILRREGVADAYEQLKSLTRGEKLTLESLHAWVDGLAISDTVKRELKSLKPATYVGLAPLLSRSLS